MSIHPRVFVHLSQGVNPRVRQLRLIDFGLLFLGASFISESMAKVNYIFLFEESYTITMTGIDSPLLMY